MRFLILAHILILAHQATGFSPSSLPLLRMHKTSDAAISKQVQLRTTSLVMKAQEAGGGLTRRSVLGLLISAPAAALAQPQVKPEVVVPCDQAISRLVNMRTGQEMYIIGTAHISQLSAELVRATIQSVKPDTVMIELDEKRVRRGVGTPKSEQADKREEKPQSVWQLLRAEFGRSGPSFGEKVKNFESGLIGMVIGGLYDKLNKMGFSSGQEFVVAIQEARALNATIVLGDRSVDKTLSRLQESINKSGFKAVQQFIEAQSSGLATAGIATEFETMEKGEDVEAIAKTVEALKERSTVRGLMTTLKENLPEVYTALIQERDEYMANSLIRADGKSSVAVVGMAHMDGIERTLGAAGFDPAPLCPASP